MAEVQNFQRFLLGIISVAVGVLLLYQAYLEQEQVFMLVYWALGIVAMGSGLYLMLRAPARAGKEEVRQEVSLPPECPSCGAAVASAGKFCGSCGAPLVARGDEE
jgi:hypothetical protein